MRHLSRILCCTTLVVAATASCGGSTTTPAGATPPATTPTSQRQRAAFPLTITRTGGIAGFQDVLVVAGDGLVSVTRKGQKPRRCQLVPGAVERLTTAVSQVPWSRITPGSTHPSYPDDMVTTVQSRAGGPVRLEDPHTGQAGQVFLELLNDLTGGTAASRLCPPV
jgi:hypothetical protein